MTWRLTSILACGVIAMNHVFWFPMAIVVLVLAIFELVTALKNHHRYRFEEKLLDEWERRLR